MFKTLRILVAITAVMMISATAFATDPLTQTVKDGCKAELESYCKGVTPGEGRVLACLYAHEDKLSAKCEFALFDAAVLLDRAVSALAYAAYECEDDLEKYCADVPVGEGRLLDCIAKNKKKVSKRCLDALTETGLK
ncbi:cysteine rich repeat-containing protein [uncultured Desulfosarcina sp.]|uniref:cysteine rich repeat-containing protein n=1 Tax=uncultured Desulfosarcina sp. TaxID=218289 RepID=UPI0029C8E940|nr:cysteine rich repeat-containing protein [uncultured Desulfosarcina sp.]